MPKTIWIINQYAMTPDNGYAGRSFYIGRNLARLGYKVTIIAASSTHLLRHSVSVTGKYTKRSMDGMDFVWVRVPDYDNAHSKARVFNWFRFATALLRIDGFLDERPDIVLCSSPSLISWLGAERLAARHKTRLLFEVRDIWPLTLQELGGYSIRHPFILFLRWIERNAYRRADLTLSPLPNAHEHMLASGLPDHENFLWLPNGIDTDEFEVQAAIPATVTEAIPDNCFVVGYAGTLGEANALETLVEAARLLADDKTIQFVLVGDGRMKDSLKHKAEESNTQNITFVDAVNKRDVPATLSTFDACYVGARQSPLYRFGVGMNKIAEYMMAAKPIIYAIDSGEYHPVEEAQCGVEIRPDDPKALAHAVKVLSQKSASERNAMGARGRRFALLNFDYKQIASKLDARLGGNKKAP